MMFVSFAMEMLDTGVSTDDRDICDGGLVGTAKILCSVSQD